MTTAAAAAAGGVAALGSAAIQSFADYEQLVGGAELMFGDAYEYIADKAKNAYSTVQLSQNEYLQQANGFATGLKTALDGDTKAAAELTDKILKAEADIVAATGNSQESVQNAFNGIMKSNFTMLDNLQIGITPTKEGFQEVIDKVNEWNAANGNATKYQIDNLADCQSALVDYIDMQGLSNYAQEEAASTIQGSLSMTKAAWSNLLTGMADDDQNLEELVDNFVDSVAKTAGNLLPRVEIAIEGVGNLVENLLPVIINRLPQIINNVLPQLLQSGSNMLLAVIAGIQENLPCIIESAMNIIDVLINAFMPMLPQLIESGMMILVAFIEGITQSLPELVPVIVDVVLLIVQALIENAPMLLMAGLELIMTLAGSLITYVPELLAKVPELLTLLKDKFLELLSGFSDIGEAIVEGIWSGLSAGWSWLVGKVKDLASGLFKAAKDALDINSPSKKFEWIAKMCVAGWDKGAEGLMSTDLIKRNVDANIDTLQMNASSVSSGGSIAGYGAFYQTVNVNQPVSTPDEMARAMRLEMRYGLMKGVPVGT